jgi:hypothetical protein
MKKLLFLAALLLLTAGLYSQQKPSPDRKKLQWLIGNWKRTNAKPGQVNTESWVTASPLKLTGKGITTRGTDTVFVEKLSIIVKDNAMFYVADVTGNPQPVYFKCTALTTTSFVCENPVNDFPSK